MKTMTSRRTFLRSLLSAGVAANMPLWAATPARAAIDPATAMTAAKLAASVYGLFARKPRQPDIVALLRGNADLISALSDQVTAIDKRLVAVQNAIEELRQLMTALPAQVSKTIFVDQKAKGAINLAQQAQASYLRELRRTASPSAAAAAIGPRLQEAETEIRKTRAIIQTFQSDDVIPVMCELLSMETQLAVLQGFDAPGACTNLQVMLEVYRRYLETYIGPGGDAIFGRMDAVVATRFDAIKALKPDLRWASGPSANGEPRLFLLPRVLRREARRCRGNSLARFPLPADPGVRLDEADGTARLRPTATFRWTAGGVVEAEPRTVISPLFPEGSEDDRLIRELTDDLWIDYSDIPAVVLPETAGETSRQGDFLYYSNTIRDAYLDSYQGDLDLMTPYGNGDAQRDAFDAMTRCADPETSALRGIPWDDPALRLELTEEEKDLSDILSRTGLLLVTLGSNHRLCVSALDYIGRLEGGLDAC